MEAEGRLDLDFSLRAEKKNRLYSSLLYSPSRLPPASPSASVNPSENVKLILDAHLQKPSFPLISLSISSIAHKTP